MNQNKPPHQSLFALSPEEGISLMLINEEEQARILELIAQQTWPHGWTGNERRGDEPVPQVVCDGMIQPLLQWEGEPTER